MTTSRDPAPDPAPLPLPKPPAKALIWDFRSPPAYYLNSPALIKDLVEENNRLRNLLDEAIGLVGHAKEDFMRREQELAKREKAGG